MNTSSDNDKPVLCLIRQQPEPRTLTILSQETAPCHPLDGYLSFLKSHNYVNNDELLALTTALKPLRQHFEELSTVTAVRAELGAEGVTVDSLRRDEKSRWETENFMPWFNLKAALDTFLVPLEEAEQYVIFFNEKCRKNAQPFIRPGLENGETFFWIILRMYRLHAKTLAQNCPTKKQTWRHRWLPFLFR